MTDKKVAALNPTVRRALGKQPVAPEPPASQAPQESGSEYCPRCHDIGIVPADQSGPPVFAACPVCRSSGLTLLVARIGANSWIAVRDQRDLWGAGPSAIDALLNLESRTPDSASTFAPRYLRYAPGARASHGQAQGRSGRVA